MFLTEYEIRCIPSDTKSHIMTPFSFFRLNRKFIPFLLFLTLTAPMGHADMSDDGIWSDTTAITKAIPAEQPIKPQKYRLVAFDKALFDNVMSKAPMEGIALKTPVLFSLPMPDGEFQLFEVVETQLMHPDLAAKFPEIKTYKGIGYDDPSAWARFDWTPAGFHGYTRTSKGTIYIDPYTKGNTQEYMSYFRKDFQRDAANMEPEAPPLIPKEADDEMLNVTKDLVKTTGANLRTYRLAVAATGEYTTYHGGASGAAAAIVSAINRVTGIYENDVAVSFQIIPDNDLLIYTDGGSDPYTNESGVAMLSQNQTNIDRVIGNTYYDVGHVFSTGGGGIAQLWVPCVTGSKAKGVTGTSDPTNDPFWVDYVAHEIGHQFGGNHTFNGNEGSCSGSNRNPGTAYEPGSGSTIMAYAGICGSQDVQNSSSTAGGVSDDYFHVESIDEIVAYTTTGYGNTCAAISATGNNPPSADAGTGGFYIPASTPFVLTGVGADPDGSETLTYTWEQYDLGPAGIPDASTLGPLFRSREGTTDPSRYFPQLSDILSGVNGNTWEVLPAISRELNFKLTVKDKDNSLAGTGGVDTDMITFHVDGTAGPFKVTHPNTFSIFQAGDALNVTWDVANTNGGNVNCPNVDILLSTDGGLTFSSTLASNTPNDGTQTVALPNISTTGGRVVVGCSDNIFFDISDSSFHIPGTIVESIDVPKAISDSGTSTTTSTLYFPDSMIIQDINLVNLAGTHTWINDIEFTLISPQGTMVLAMARRCSNQDNFDINLDDESAIPLTLAPCPPTDGGYYQPSNPLSTFDGEDAKGTWTLTVNDYVSGDGGSLNSWGIEVTAPSTTYNCSGTDPVISNKTFAAGEVITCIGTNSLGTNSSVVVSSGSTVKFVAPTVNLNPGFTVQSGATFNACTSAPCP
jgi:subtilisin-like proprotein convertase family protein